MIARVFITIRAYFLAAAGTAEFKDCSRNKEIVRQIVRWSLGEFNLNEWECKDYIFSEDPKKSQAENVLRETDRETSVTSLLELLRDSESEGIRLQVAEILGEVGSGNEQAIAGLLELLRDSESESIWEQAAESLGKIGKGNEQAIAGLLELLGNIESESIRWRVVISLGKIGKGNEQAIAGLVELLRNSESEYIRRQAAESLEKVVTTEKQICEAIAEVQRYICQDIYRGQPKFFSAVYQLLWDSAQTLPYPVFYRAWQKGK